MSKPLHVEPLERRAYLTVAFAAPQNFNVPSITGGILTAPAIGLFDADTIPDLIVGNATEDAGGVTNLLFAKGNGDGTFTPASTPITPGVFTSQPKAGDFNGDDKLDIAVSDELDDLIRVLFGNGDGTFQLPVSVTVGTAPGNIAVGNLNGDAFDDLVVNNRGGLTDRGNDVVSVILGGAMLGAPASVTVGDDPASLLLANVNGDANLDLVVGNSGGQAATAGTLMTFLGNGNGTFASTPVTTAGPRGISDAGDFNGDGKLDLVVSVSETGIVTVLPGNGDGTFTNVAPPNEDQFLAVAGDFDADGKVDLAATGIVAGNLSILPGLGNGTFGARQDVAIEGAAGVSVGNFAGDGNLDLALASFVETVGPRITSLVNTSTPGPNPTAGPDLTATIAGKLPTSAVVGGTTKGKFVVTVTNGSTDTELPRTAVTVRLVASSDTTPADADPQIASITKNLRLKVGKSAKIAFNIKFPVVPTDGPYNIIAQVDPANAITESAEDNNTATASAPVTIAAPFVDLRGTFAKALPATLTANKTGAFQLSVENLGNIAAKGAVPVVLIASTDNALGGTNDVALGTASPKVNIAPGKTKKVNLRLKLPATLPAGTYFVIAQLNQGGTIVETDTTNNLIVSTDQTTVA